MAFKRIKQFPKNYPWYKRWFATVAFNVAGTIIFPRKNLLSEEDIKTAKKTLKKGDILLLGNLRTIFSSILNDPVTHSALCMNNAKDVVHSIAKGTVVDSLQTILTTYDTIVILRIPKQTPHKKKCITHAIRFAKKRIGQPYNFYFEEKETCLFCSALINKSYLQAGYETGVKTFESEMELMNLVKIKIPDFVNAIRPVNFINSNFEVVFHSHNIEIKDGKVRFLEFRKNIKSWVTNIIRKTRSAS